MRNLLVLSAAASALALLSTHQVAALSPGMTTKSPHGLVQKAQKSDDSPGTRGQDGAQRGAEPGKGSEGGKRSSTAQQKGESGKNMQSGDNNMRSGQNRTGSSEKGTRGAKQRTDVDVNVNRGRQGQRDRLDRRTRVGVDVDSRHRSGRRDVDIGVRGGSGVRSYGYSSTNCVEIRRRYSQCFR